jgi:hypothetical protein
MEEILDKLEKRLANIERMLSELHQLYYEKDMTGKVINILREKSNG